MCEKGESQELRAAVCLFLELMQPLLSVNPALTVRRGKKLSRLWSLEMDLSEVPEIIRVEP